MSYEMNDLLELMVDQGASDLHIEVNQPPTLRISGSMLPVEGPKLDPQGAESLMKYQHLAAKLAELHMTNVMTDFFSTMGIEVKVEGDE